MDMTPIRVSRRVGCSPAGAFHAFTTRMGEWWDPRLTPDPATYDGVLVEPRVGGDVRLVHLGQDPYLIGEVTAWEEGRRYAQTFTLALTHPTTLTVDFVGDESGTTVSLTHAGWSPQHGEDRAKFTEWPQLLDRFAAMVESAQGRVGPAQGPRQ